MTNLRGPDLLQRMADTLAEAYERGAIVTALLMNSEDAEAFSKYLTVMSGIPYHQIQSYAGVPISTVGSLQRGEIKVKEAGVI